MARIQRRVDRLDFSLEDLGPVVAAMASVRAAGDGWINVQPRPARGDAPPTTLRFLTLLGGGGSGLAMASWVLRTGADGARAELGISHQSGRRALPQLSGSGLTLPPGAAVAQDHPRRGLVLVLGEPPDDEGALRFGLAALAALAALPRPGAFAAEVHHAPGAP